MGSNEEMEKMKFKICVLGDASVGKTSLIHRYVEGQFKESYLATIGVAFLTKTLELSFKGKMTKISLQVWDIAGQSIFSKIRQNYLRGSQGAFILFDVTSKSTLMHVDAWIEELLRALSLKELKNFPLVVLGNKIDLNFDERLKERAKQFLEHQYKTPIPITFTSAKTGQGMEDAFEQITSLMIKQASER